MMSYYALQFKVHDWDNKWETAPGKYGTIADAEAARQKKPFPSHYRIAETYTVIRYKAVKI